MKLMNTKEDISEEAVQFPYIVTKLPEESIYVISLKFSNVQIRCNFFYIGEFEEGKTYLKTKD